MAGQSRQAIIERISTLWPSDNDLVSQLVDELSAEDKTDSYVSHISRLEYAIGQLHAQRTEAENLR